MGRIVRIRIDTMACLCDAFCIVECPAVFRVDEASHYPRIAPDAGGLYVTHDAAIREAVEICPYDAIHIEEVDEDEGEEGAGDAEAGQCPE